MVREYLIICMKKISKSILFFSAIFCFLPLTSSGILKNSGASSNVIQNKMLQEGNPVKINFFNLEIVAPSAGVQFYRDGIVFLGQSKNHVRMVPSHVSFGTIQAYYAATGDTSLNDPVLFSPDFRFSYPCDAISFSMSYDKMYFTGKEKKGKFNKIFVSDYSGGPSGKGSWSKPEQALDFCTGNFTYTHPALSADGQMMIFSSDREGTTGNHDLFITRKNGDLWSAPENLGRLINTGSDELYPFLDNSNNLYFSSNGHPGYGGYDIFVSKFNGKRWEEPFNLTKLINSPDDDVAFTLNRLNGKTGFYSSIDNVNKKYAQLYKISFEEVSSPGNIANLSEVFLEKAIADTTFTYRKLLIAKADDIARAEEEAKIAEAEKNAKAAEAEKIAEAIKTEEARAAEAKRLAEETRAAEAKRLEEEARAAEARRLEEEARAAEARRLAEETEAAEKLKAELAARQAKPKVDTVKVISAVSETLKNIVVYRVQFLSSTTQKDIKEVVAEGKSYTPYIYFYLKEYRYTAGEFTTLEPAKQLQFALRRAGYPQAFVAAFKNNVRSLDLSLFR